MGACPLPHSSRRLSSHPLHPGGIVAQPFFPPAVGAIASLKVLLMEELRIVDRLSKKKDLVMTVAAGRSMEAEEVVRDAISVPIEIYKRARAYFWTIAFICVRNKRA